jgi:sulfur-oxidizing protein SoxZ
MARALINAPARARRGQVIEIKTLISHVMETGFRYTSTGELVPRDIITAFTATYNGEEVFRTQLYPAIAANPFIAFHTIATESGTIGSGDRRQRLLRHRADPDHGGMIAPSSRSRAQARLSGLAV